MSELAELIQDLRAHAHEAPTQCAALMRRAAAELETRNRIAAIADQVRAARARSPERHNQERHNQVKGAPCS